MDELIDRILNRSDALLSVFTPVEGEDLPDAATQRDAILKFDFENKLDAIRLPLEYMRDARERERQADSTIE